MLNDRVIERAEWARIGDSWTRSDLREKDRVVGAGLRQAQGALAGGAAAAAAADLCE